MSFFSKLLGYMSTIIKFKDINVKEALLASSDINPDGTRDITYNEAQGTNVTFGIIKNAINPNGTGNTDIVYFKELKHFKIGASGIPNDMFKGCINLTEIEFPYVERLGGVNPICIFGTDILDGTNIEQLKLNSPIIFASTSSSNYGTMNNLKEVWVKGITQIVGKLFTKAQMPNIERIVVDSADQWVSMQVSDGSLIHGGNNVRPNVSEKASLYTENNGVLTKLTELNLSSSVTALTHWAFAYLKDITKITLNGYVTCGDYCFAGLPETTTIENSYYITTIGNACFKNCEAQGITNIPENTTSLGSDCFAGANIEKIVSTKLKSFDYRALKGSTIQSIWINLDQPSDPQEPRNIITFNSYPTGNYEPCSDCLNLKTVYLNPVQSLGYNVFARCTNLETVTCVELTDTAANTFSGCTKLSTFNATILTSIGAGTFDGDVLLETINFNLSVCTLIGSYAFRNCAKIQCPSSFTAITEIGAGAFTGCIAPTTSTYVILNVNQKVTFQKCTGSFSQLVIYASPFPSSVTTIYVPDVQVDGVDLIDLYIGSAAQQYTDGDEDWKKCVQVSNLTFAKLSQLST